ncbi:sugar transferase [Flavobacterium oreochromis]|uniref:sugar transferase n=1 Tax=Flavobacterium oreochromis TaxID=2906078 RepID=UPI001F27C5DB|nr:sugar transferase [Flavobacterium oreochromis]
MFLQVRIGQFGKEFLVYKFKTIKGSKISKIGNFLRKYKIDELPQLFNILKGEMSFVGPRPDLKGYYDNVQGEFLKILELKPGLTSEAALKYFSEDLLLSKQDNPEEYNDEIIFPDKLKMNLDYYYKRKFSVDLLVIIRTIKKILSYNAKR